MHKADQKKIYENRTFYQFNFDPQHLLAHGVLHWILELILVWGSQSQIGLLHRGTKKFNEYKTHVLCGHLNYVLMMEKAYIYALILCLNISLLDKNTKKLIAYRSDIKKNMFKLKRKTKKLTKNYQEHFSLFVNVAFTSWEEVFGFSFNIYFLLPIVFVGVFLSLRFSRDYIEDLLVKYEDFLLATWTLIWDLESKLKLPTQTLQKEESKNQKEESKNQKEESKNQKEESKNQKEESKNQEKDSSDQKNKSDDQKKETNSKKKSPEETRKQIGDIILVAFTVCCLIIFVIDLIYS